MNFEEYLTENKFKFKSKFGKAPRIKDLKKFNAKADEIAERLKKSHPNMDIRRVNANGVNHVYSEKTGEIYADWSEKDKSGWIGDDNIKFAKE